MPLPAVSWMSGVFNQDFSFNCTTFDQASGNPELSGQFALPDDQILNGGWIYRDGRLGRIVWAKKRVARAPETLLPVGIELQARDEFERTMDLRGTLAASCPWQVWPNSITLVCQIRWECGSLVTYGDSQDVLWGDYVNDMASR